MPPSVQPPTVPDYSPAQLDAIIDAQDADAEAGRHKRGPGAIAAALAAEGHALFAAAPPATQAATVRDPFGVGAPQHLASGARAAAQPAQPAAASLPAASPPPAAVVVAEREPASLPLARAEPSPAAGAVEGLEGLDASDMVVPSLKLRQAMSKDASDVPEGHWFVREATDEHSAERQIVVLAVHKGRAFLGPYAEEARAQLLQQLHAQAGVDVPDGHEGPICASRDRLTPYEQRPDLRVLSPRCSETCGGREHVVCPWAQWRTVAGKRRPPHCGETYTLLAYDLGLGSPVRIRLRSTAIEPTKGLLTKLAIAARLTKAPGFGFRLVLGARKETNERREAFYVPSYTGLERLNDADEIEMYRGLAAGLAAAGAAHQASDDAGDGAAGGGAGGERACDRHGHAGLVPRDARHLGGWDPPSDRGACVP